MIDIVCPKWGLTMEEAEVGSWLVAVGDRVARGAVVCELTTDKVTSEVEAPEDGILAEIVAATGTIVHPGEIIARLEVSE